MAKNIWLLRENVVTLHSFCGSSCKAVKKDALSSDMRLRWRPQSAKEVTLMFNRAK